MDSIDNNFNLHSWQIPEQTAGMQVWRRQNLTFVDSGLSCDTFNIIHVTNGTAILKEEITTAIGYFRHRHLSFCIWISEKNLTEKVKDYFSELSVVQKNSEPGMILDLDGYERFEDKLHESIAIATSVRHIEDYAAVIAANWNPPDKNVIDYYRTTRHNYLSPNHGIFLLIYYVQGAPVGTLEMFPSDDQTVGLYGLATLSGFRGKGIGHAMLTYSLNRAKENGYRQVVLQASEEGLRLYQRIGFQQRTTFYEYA